MNLDADNEASIEKRFLADTLNNVKCDVVSRTCQFAVSAATNCAANANPLGKSAEGFLKNKGGEFCETTLAECKKTASG